MQEAIWLATDTLYDGNHELLPLGNESFIHLLRLVMKNMIMSTHNGLYRQVDGLAMGSTASLPFVDLWLHQFERAFKQRNLMLFHKYVDAYCVSLRKWIRT